MSCCDKILKKKATALVFESSKNKKNADGNTVVKTEQDCDPKAISLKVQELTTGFHGTRLKATFPELVQKMIQRHKDCNRNFGDSAFVMCSFDGAIHGNSNVVSFSTQVLSHIMTKDEATTTTTDNILTWQQIECPEKVYAILEAVEDHFKEKQVARETIQMIDNNCKVYYCSVHDYKMLYLLLGHCHWQCNDSPYPLCGCNRGDGARDNR